MAKIATLGTYLYQAGLAFGLLIFVSNRLPSAEFTAYSLFVSATQFAAIAGFEWIRFACSRFYPGPDAASEAAERSALRREFLACCLICIAAAASTPLLGVTWAVAGFGVLAVIGQAGTELHLTMLRFRQDFRLFSRLQAARATLMAAGTAAGALAGPDLPHVLAGMMAGYAVYAGLVFAGARAPHASPAPASRWDPAVTRRHLVYGSVSASASTAAMLAPLGLKAILTGTLGANAAAGAILALDLLQRPFQLVVSSLQAIRYPELVSLYDRTGDGPELRSALGRYYALLVSYSLLGGAVIVALLGLATAIVIAPDLRSSFLRTAPLVLLLALLRSLVQIWLPTAAHLQRRLPAIAGLAVADCLLTGAGAGIGALGWGSDLAIMSGALAGALAAMACGLALLRMQPFAMIWRPVLFSAAGLVLAWAIAACFAGDLLRSTAYALAAAAVLGAPVLLRTLGWVAR